MRGIGGLVARFLVLLFCLGTALLIFQAQASAETRSLKIYNVHTAEKATITYKRNGHYIRSGLNKLDYILRDWRKDKQIDMDPRMLDLLWEVYQKSGSHDYIHIICGYRTGDTNAMLRGRSRASGVAKKSQHILGKAIDFYIPDVPLERLREIGMKFQVGGVGYYPNSGSPFVHMDTGWVRAWPRMSRQQLVKLFPNGHTLHLPPDGKPLPGYQEALADYKRRVDGNSIMVAGGGSSGNRSGNGNLLAALFGVGDEDEELGADDTVQTDPSLHRIERKAMAARKSASPSKAAPVTLPKPSDAPLPGVRPVAVAAVMPQQTAPVPAAESESAAAGKPDQEFPDLLAYAIPAPQFRPDRAGDSAQDATAALIADANADMPADDRATPSAKADETTKLAMAVPVPGIRPELTAYAPTPAPDEAPAPVLEDATKTAGEPAKPKLSPSVIAKAMKKQAVRINDKIIMASLDAEPAMHVRAEAKPAETVEPASFTTVSGAAVRGGRVGGTNELSKDTISEWARARREAGTLVRPFAKGTAAPRMNRLPARTADAEASDTQIDPWRFAAVSVYFPND